MSEPDAIRWLHLSDFHVGMDDYAQRKLFAEIIREIRSRIDGGEGPDFVFVTGDLANTGVEGQYANFFKVGHNGGALHSPVHERVGLRGECGAGTGRGDRGHAPLRHHARGIELADLLVQIVPGVAE